MVRRIFSAYADGATPRAIAGELNREGIPPPRGARWNASTINGSAQRRNGLPHNEIYVGRIVCNRVGMVRDPSTGRRVFRPKPPEAWRIAEAPHLRIVDEDVFEMVNRRRQSRTGDPRSHRTPRRLLSGLLNAAPAAEECRSTTRTRRARRAFAARRRARAAPAATAGSITSRRSRRSFSMVCVKSWMEGLNEIGRGVAVGTAFPRPIAACRSYP